MLSLTNIYTLYFRLYICLSKSFNDAQAPGIKAIMVSPDDDKLRILLLNLNMETEKFNEEQLQVIYLISYVNLIIVNI